MMSRGNFGNEGQVQDIAAGIANSFGKEGLRVPANRPFPGLFVVGIYKGEFHSQLGECVLKLGDRAAINGLGGDDVIACLKQSEKDCRLRGQSTAESYGASPTLEAG